MTQERALPTSDPEPLAFPRAAGRISYVDEGPRGALALLTAHGIPGSARDFRYLAPQLSARVRLVRVDLPGFGASAPEEAAVRRLEARAHALLELADHLAIARFGVLGHSMGGGPALLLAASHPERVSHLILLASVGLTRHRGLGMSPSLFRLLGRALLWPVVGPLLLPGAREQYKKRRFPGIERMTPRDYSIQLRSIGALSFAALRAALQRNLPPTLVAYSRDDQLLEPEIAEDLARRIPGARRLVFEAGGHNLQKTRAPELAAAILDFLGR